MIPARLYLFNRAPQVTADGWVHIVPKGELANAAANLVQVIDDPALDSILRNLEHDKMTLGNRWPGLYAGREHFIYDADQDSAALAWFKDFEKRPDGIWANADGLTPPGRQAIKNGAYKFTSFVADRKDTEKLAGNRVRILKVETIGFTNQANGKELLTPITNRGAHGPTPTGTVPARPAAVSSAPIGHRIYDAVAMLVSNRLKSNLGGFDMAHALVCTRNKDLFAQPYEAMHTALKFSTLVNRVANRAGLSPVRSTERSADDAAALTMRFLPALVAMPAATQFDALWRAADALAEAGVPYRLCNRTVSTERVRDSRQGVDSVGDANKTDWKEANKVADDVFTLLDGQATRPVDRGATLEYARAPQIRGVFKNAIERLMREQGLDRRQAFDRLKADEPIFWTLAMLSFDPEQP